MYNERKTVMKQCNNGHIFDEMLYSVCPYCSNNGNSGFRPLNNMPNGAPPFPGADPMNAPMYPGPDPMMNAPAFPSTVPLNKPAVDPSFPKTTPLNDPTPAPNAKKEMSATVALNTTDSGINPVRGWLVVIEGDKKGLSFNVHSEKNIIGRGNACDVNLSFDSSASKDGDAILSFDARNKKFFLSPASGKNNVYFNSSLLLTPVEVTDYDTIEVGSTKLVFRSFCNDNYIY